MKIAANGIELFNLDLLDMESMQVNALLQQTPRLGHVTISPDGGWVAYTMGSPDLTVYALPVRDTPQAVKLGACVTETDGHCEQLSWSPDGKSLAWNGAQGIWLADLSSLKTSLVHTRQVVVKDPKGENTEIDIDFLSLSWSPLGRFLLTQIALSSSDVKWLAVLDSLTGRLAQVPDTFEHRTPQTHALWLEDGLLLLAFNEGETSQPYLHIKLWQVVVTNNDLLVPRDISALIPGDFQIPVPQDLTGSSLCPKWLAQLEQGKLLLEIALPNGLSAPWLFALDLQKQALSKLYDLPNDTVDILWSPDGGGALILGGHSQIIFVPADGSPFYSLLPGLGKDAHEFQWLPPSPRT
jgi:WD40 repeat protein